MGSFNTTAHTLFYNITVLTNRLITRVCTVFDYLPGLLMSDEIPMFLSVLNTLLSCGLTECESALFFIDLYLY